MPGTYRARGIVLKRTKLGETDLIVTFLSDASSQVRAVAKGARKPGSRLAGVVDLGNEVELLLRRGRGLDMVSEGKLVTSRASLALDYDRSSTVSVVLDCAAEFTVEGDYDPRLYALTSTALDAVARAENGRLSLVAAAYILKAAAMQGFRPALDDCVRCGEPIDYGAAAQKGRGVAFALREGGVVCDGCADVECGRSYSPALIGWVRALIRSRFSELLAIEPQPGEDELGRDLLQFASTWVGCFPGIRPRALQFVLTGTEG